MTNREIDKLIAEKVFGLIPFQKQMWVDGTHIGYIDSWLDESYKEVTHNLPNYSADIAVAWTIIEHLRKENKDTAVQIETIEDSNDYYCSIVVGKRRAQDVAATVPLAICVAALYLKGIEVGEISND